MCHSYFFLVAVAADVSAQRASLRKGKKRDRQTRGEVVGCLPACLPGRLIFDTLYPSLGRRRVLLAGVACFRLLIAHGEQSGDERDIAKRDGEGFRVEIEHVERSLPVFSSDGVNTDGRRT